jgi:hypothetical protein
MPKSQSRIELASQCALVAAISCATIFWSFVSASAAENAPQSAVEFKQLSPKATDGHVSIGISIKNLTSALIGVAFIDCVALSASGDVIDDGIQNISNLRPGETAYAFVPLLDTTSLKVDAKCRVSSVQ